MLRYDGWVSSVFTSLRLEQLFSVSDYGITLKADFGVSPSRAGVRDACTEGTSRGRLRMSCSTRATPPITQASWRNEETTIWVV